MLATLVFFEFALPLHARAANSPVFVAQRDSMSSRLATSIVPKRDICSLIACGPTYRILRSQTIVMTAYSSTPDQTSGDPFITASGSRVHHGTLALNGIPFGTKVRIPDYYGDQIFTVEDRMSSRYSSQRGDIWMETRHEAKQWGVRRVHVEFVVEE